MKLCLNAYTYRIVPQSMLHGNEGLRYYFNSINYKLIFEHTFIIKKSESIYFQVQKYSMKVPCGSTIGILWENIFEKVCFLIFYFFHGIFLMKFYPLHSGRTVLVFIKIDGNNLENSLVFQGSLSRNLFF